MSSSHSKSDEAGGAIELAVLSVPVEPASWPEELTDAERDVARRLICGRAYADIAEERGTSRHTVSSQISSMLDKLGVASTSELIALLARRTR